MNERIKQLATQAGYKDFDYAIIAHKFAELIIRDCIDCVDGYTKFRTPGTHYDAVEQIKANFGIKDENKNS